MTSCIIICGPPASGKSSLAQEYLESFGFMRLERDIIRREWFGFISWDSWDWKLEKKVTKVWNEQFNEMTSKGVRFVISDTLCNKGKRESIVARLEKLGYNVDVVILCPSIEELIARDKLRGSFSVGEDVIKNMWRELNDNCN